MAGLTGSRKGLWIGMVGIAIWSTSGVVISYLITRYGMLPLQLAFWRNLFVVLALGIALQVGKPALLHIPQGKLGYFVGYGMVLALFNTIWMISLAENGAAVATVLGYSSAGFTAIIAFFLFKEKIGIHKGIAIVLSLGGCILVANALDPATWALKPLGAATGILSGVIFSVYTLYGKHGAHLGINVWTSLFASFLFGTVFIFLFNLIPGFPGATATVWQLFPVLGWAGWGAILALAVGPTLLGFGLYNMSMQYLPASIANLLATTEPIMTAIEAYIFLGERLTPVQMVGSVVILSAVVIVQWERSAE